MSVALHGNLRDFGIGEVFQLIGQQRKTGVLEMSGSDGRIQVSFDQGSVVSGERCGAYPRAALGEMLVRTGVIVPERLARIEEELSEGNTDTERLLLEGGDVSAEQLDEVIDLVTKDTIFALLRWTQGSFHFHSQPVKHRRDPRRLLPAEQILMDGLRMVDEWRTLDAAATRDDAVLERVGRFETFREANPQEAPERLAVAERLFLLVDGRLPVRRVIDLSRLGDFEGARLLSRLRAAGVIEPVDPERLARSRRRRSPEPVQGNALPSLLGLVPVLVLATIVGVIAIRPPSQADPEAAVLREQVLLEVEARRVRRLLDAYRFAEGRLPEGLEDALRWADPSGALAPSEGAPYYYAQRDRSFVLLTPEQ